MGREGPAPSWFGHDGIDLREEYLVQALLAGSRRLQVLCAPHYLSRRHSEAMRRAFGDGVAQGHRFEGASLWLRSV